MNSTPLRCSHDFQPFLARNRVSSLPGADGDDVLADITSEHYSTRPQVDDVGHGFHACDDTTRIAESQCKLHRTGAHEIATIRIMGEEPSDRLEHARRQAGHESAAAFARAHDIPEPTYRAHENGSRALTLRAAKQYAPLLNVTATWLMFGDKDIPAPELIAIMEDFVDMLPEDQDDIRDLIQKRAQRARQRRQQES